MKNRFAFTALLVISMLSSCNLINPEEQAPSYLELKTFQLSTNYTTQGTNSHKIKDAWNFPSNIYPPGLTFAFMKFQSRLHLMVMYFEEVISEEEMDKIEKQIRYELIFGIEINS